MTMTPTARQSAHADALARNVEIRRAYAVEEYVAPKSRRRRWWFLSFNPRVGARAGE